MSFKANVMKYRLRQRVTAAIRWCAFAVTLVPLAALFLPWLALEGSGEFRTGVSSIALLASPLREYLFTADPLQASIITMGPILIFMLTFATAKRYYERRSVVWAPPAMLLVALAIIYQTTNLTSAVYQGPSLVAAVAIALTLHQGAIRLLVAMRRSRRLFRTYRPLAIATGVQEWR